MGRRHGFRTPSWTSFPLVAPQTLNAVDGRLTLHTAPSHGVSHQITGPKTAQCRPGANDSTTFKRCMQIVRLPALTDIRSRCDGHIGQTQPKEVRTLCSTLWHWCAGSDRSLKAPVLRAGKHALPRSAVHSANLSKCSGLNSQRIKKCE